MTRRRIFRPAPAPRRWRGLAMGSVLGMVALALAGLGLPANLFGSAPREQDWNAAATQVRVVDGDTLRLGERTLRLAGLVSPPRGQTCSTAHGVGFDCGGAAAQALAQLVQNRDLNCRVQGRDRFGRALGVCQAGGMETNAALVASGWALAEGGALQAEEQAARGAGRGLWSHRDGAPESWRSRF
ncbi:thermonuclease family protein [Pseudoroseomonas cervicalis]|uniref:thermonuclease family protein n=1 Tax=Teichococcus cervicalis TaxID=204525 RepID=UPI0022F1D128|nr:thermonuclease family protein [Pseudoroseomonas cervicalis]WBV42111.1 thermonuclease family protein [Pseudoroseomonas cervicalis]